MKKFFQSPERLFSFAMWMVSLLLASFLISLGGKVIADLPMATKSVSIDDFTDGSVMSNARSELSRAQRNLRELTLSQNEARGEFEKKSNDYSEAQASHRNWLATRNVTSNNPDAINQDPELISRSQRLDKLGEERRQAQAKQEAIQSERMAAERAIFEAQEVIKKEISEANPAFGQAKRFSELKIFGMRLALTLPLLVLAGWMIYKKRKSRYWPLHRGFVIFAAFAFFFELVPYLPSYGGYVRSVAGIIICLVAAVYGIRWMQGYLVRRQEESKRNEQERRSTLNDVLAIQKMNAQLCPGCDRPIAPSLDGVKVNHCVYCGLKLFDFCAAKVESTQEACGVRKNAFYKHCPSCGAEKP